MQGQKKKARFVLSSFLRQTKREIGMVGSSSVEVHAISAARRKYLQEKGNGVWVMSGLGLMGKTARSPGREETLNRRTVALKVV